MAHTEKLYLVVYWPMLEDWSHEGIRASFWSRAEAEAWMHEELDRLFRDMLADKELAVHENLKSELENDSDSEDSEDFEILEITVPSRA